MAGELRHAGPVLHVPHSDRGQVSTLPRHQIPTILRPEIDIMTVLLSMSATQLHQDQIVLRPRVGLTGCLYYRQLPNGFSMNSEQLKFTALPITQSKLPGEKQHLDLIDYFL